VIGASTGGPNAIQKVLFDFPRDISIPIICIQHITDGYIESFTSWLSSNCKLKVKIFSEGENPQPGYVYFPQNMKHLIIKDDGKLYSSNESPYNGHCPSINVAFESFAKHFASKTLGIILTGMGDDGAKGLLSIKLKGGMTIGEDETTCTVYGMPRVAKELGALSLSLPLHKITDKILSSI
jgi:two-component system chemotaxis response regulator CheB